MRGGGGEPGANVMKDNLFNHWKFCFSINAQTFSNSSTICYTKLGKGGGAEKIVPSRQLHSGKQVQILSVATC